VLINPRHLQASAHDRFIPTDHGLIVGSDHTSSPKKRKAQGPQQAAPPPTSQPQYTSPPFSQTGSSVSNTPSSRRRGHSRQRSDISSRGHDSYGRPTSRHRHTESGFSTQSGTSPTQPTGQEQGASPAPTDLRRGGSHPVSSLLDRSDSRPASQREPPFSVGPEMRHEERRKTPEEDDSRRPNIKRDDTKD